VLPFQNAGSDKDTDFLRLALPDEIATTLSYVPVVLDPSICHNEQVQRFKTWTCSRLVERWG
jgi:hypothetical protein